MDFKESQPGRVWSGFDYAFLWFGAAVCITEIWAGGLIANLGLTSGTLALILGHILGTLGLAYVSHLGATTLQPTMQIVRMVFGQVGAALPTTLNIIQLVGWTAVMLVVAAEATKSLYSSTGKDTLWFIVVIGSGLLTTIWTILGTRWWQIAQRFAFIILFLVSLVLTYVVLIKYPPHLIKTAPASDASLMLGIDLSIALPISWLPLAADYSRFAKHRQGVALWTFVGYFVGSCWLYWLGMYGKLATDTADPGALAMQLLGEYRLALVAIIMIFVSTLTTTFLDIYSAAVSYKVLQPKAKEPKVALIVGLIGTLIALIFPIMEYESFLLFIGSFFVPIFGVVITAGLLGKIQPQFTEVKFKTDFAAIIAWLMGFIIYIIASGPNLWPLSLFKDHLPNWLHGFEIGASLPSFIISAVVYSIFQIQNKK